MIREANKINERHLAGLDIACRTLVAMQPY